jgi:hypothetical protein
MFRFAMHGIEARLAAHHKSLAEKAYVNLPSMCANHVTMVEDRPALLFVPTPETAPKDMKRHCVQLCSVRIMFGWLND